MGRAIDNLIKEAILETYRRMYRVATPPADFDELVKNADIDEYGRKDIRYLDYELERSVGDAIMEDVIKEYRIPKPYRQSIRFNVILGCSPKDKTDER